MIVRKLSLPLHLNGTVLDTETTGLPHQNAEVVTLGIVSGNEVLILQRTKGDRPIDWQRYLKSLPRPFYAFNKEFEEKMLGIKVDRELQSRRFERKRDAISIAGLIDPFNGNGVHTLDAWRKHVKEGDRASLTQIMEHNEVDLIHEVCLAIARWREKK
jgi:hypothetical protein